MAGAPGKASGGTPTPRAAVAAVAGESAPPAACGSVSSCSSAVAERSREARPLAADVAPAAAGTGTAVEAPAAARGRFWAAAAAAAAGRCPRCRSRESRGPATLSALPIPSAASAAAAMSPRDRGWLPALTPLPEPYEAVWLWARDWKCECGARESGSDAAEGSGAWPLAPPAAGSDALIRCPRRLAAPAGSASAAREDTRRTGPSSPGTATSAYCKDGPRRLPEAAALRGPLPRSPATEAGRDRRGPAPAPTPAAAW